MRNVRTGLVGIKPSFLGATKMARLLLFFIFILASCRTTSPSSASVKNSGVVASAKDMTDMGWVALIDVGDGSYCSGSLIMPGNQILTAAHCAGHPGDRSKRDVSKMSVSVWGTAVSVVGSVIHSDWTSNTYDPIYYDVALLQLSTTFGPGKRMLLAPQGPKVGDRVELFGYGRQTANARPDKTLRYGFNNVDEVNLDFYFSTHKDDFGTNSNVDVVGFVGDSGGPVVNDSGAIVGVFNATAMPDGATPTYENKAINLNHSEISSFLTKHLPTAAWGK